MLDFWELNPAEQARVLKLDQDLGKARDFIDLLYSEGSFSRSFDHNNGWARTLTDFLYFYEDMSDGLREYFRSGPDLPLDFESRMRDFQEVIEEMKELGEDIFAIGRKWNSFVLDLLDDLYDYSMEMHREYGDIG